jgi:ketosteroid isomerase-like protein
MTAAMAEPSRAIREFFDAYAKATGSLDLAFLGSAYGDTFMFAGPGGVQAVKRDDFLKAVPKRSAFFRATGLVSSEVRRLEEMRLDEKHTMVQAYWSLRFEKDAGRPIIDEIAATYVIRREEASWQIVFQLDHQDLAKRVRELGLLPPSG